MSRLHGRDHGVHDHGHVRTVYTAVQVLCTWSVHDPYTAGTRWSCTWACLGLASTAVARLNGRVRTVYTAVHGGYGPGTRPYMIRTRPCTRPCTVHTVVFKACTRTRERTVYTAVHGPCIWSIYDPNTAVYPVPRLFTARVHGCSRSSLRPL